MTAVTPDTFVRRSPIYRLHTGSVWQAGENAAIVDHYAGNNAPDPAGAGVLIDLSPLNRTGMRGVGAQALLGGLGLPFPNAGCSTTRWHRLHRCSNWAAATTPTVFRCTAKTRTPGLPSPAAGCPR